MPVAIYPFKEIYPKLEDSVYVAENAVVIGDVEIGAHASIWFGTVVRGDVNFIRIGAGTNIQDACVIHVSSEDFPTVIEDSVTVGHKVTLHGCYVETGCLIGIGSMILDGARIGRDSLVAAGSLVTPGTLIPPRSLVMGSPARVKRELADDEIENIHKNAARYIELAAIYKNAKV